MARASLRSAFLAAKKAEINSIFEAMKATAVEYGWDLEDTEPESTDEWHELVETFQDNLSLALSLLQGEDAHRINEASQLKELTATPGMQWQTTTSDVKLEKDVPKNDTDKVVDLAAGSESVGPLLASNINVLGGDQEEDTAADPKKTAKKKPRKKGNASKSSGIKLSEVPAITLFEKLAELRTAAHSLEDTDDQSFRYQRYVYFVRYQHLLWEALKNLKDDEEGFNKLLQGSADYSRSQKTFVSVAYDRPTAFIGPFKKIIEILLTFALLPVALEKFFDEEFPEGLKLRCLSLIDERSKEIRLRKRDLHQEFEFLVQQTKTLDPLSWYYLCSKLGPSLKRRLDKLEPQEQVEVADGSDWKIYIRFAGGLETIPPDFPSDNDYTETHWANITTNESKKTIVQVERSAYNMYTDVKLPLPFLPEGWSAEKDFKAIGSLSAASQRSIEPVGPHFLAHARRARHKRTFSEDDRIQAQENVKKVEDDDSGEISEPEDPMMLSRDAKDWKQQDHYAVLGITKYRWRATEEQIKRAHRKKVLRHHPDKKAAAGNTEDDSFFKCIQKATEILTDPVKRRQYDSVDEHADVEPPTKKQVKDGNYYKLWSKVFKAEGRFSRIQPVPKFGDEKSSQEEVENFYNFFYSFDSWRSFEYLDEDVPDDNENRDQKRHMERKNNNSRKKKKNEDVARLRKLVDEALSGDKRPKMFKDAANAEKNKKKADKEAAEKKAIADAKAAKEAEAKAKVEADEKAKADKEQGKKAKEAAKAAVKKNRRVLKGSVKDANYFAKGDAPASAIDGCLNDVELIQGKLDPDETAALAGKLGGLKIADEIKGVWAAEVERLVSGGKLKAGEAKNLA